MFVARVNTPCDGVVKVHSAVCAAEVLEGADGRAAVARAVRLPLYEAVGPQRPRERSSRSGSRSKPAEA